jgi:hypothetical protein
MFLMSTRRGRPQIYCSASHRQRAYELRRARTQLAARVPSLLLGRDVDTMRTKAGIERAVVDVLRKLGSRKERKMRASGNAGGAPSAAQARPATRCAFTRYGTPCARSARWPDGRPANQVSIEAPACSLIVRRRFAHHRSIAFSAARIASRLAPPIEPSSGLGGV